MIIIGILLGILSFIIHRFIPASWIENLYSRFLFRIVRTCLDYSVGLIPFPVVYILIPVLLYVVYSWILSMRRSNLGIRGNTLQIGLSIFGAFGWLFFLFYLLWGFNYDRIGLQEQIGLETNTISEAAFKQEFLEQSNRIADLRIKEEEKINSLITGWSHKSAEKEIRAYAEDVLTGMGYPVSGRVRCRELLPRGFLLSWGTAGFYNPFTGECNIDPGLHTLQKPYVLAHELFHGLGVTGEGECNFLAYLVSHYTDDPLIKYSGELGYWRYLAGSFRRRFPDLFGEVLENMPKVVIDDIEDIDDTMDRYPNIAPKMRDAIYNAYLQSNRIHMGMADYSRVIQLVIQWRQRQESN